MKKPLFLICIFIISVLLNQFDSAISVYKATNAELKVILEGESYEQQVDSLNKELNNINAEIEKLASKNVQNSEEFSRAYKELQNKISISKQTKRKQNDKKSQLVKQKEQLVNEYNSLLKKYKELTTFKIKGVSRINQYSIGYPTGCESAALTLLLKYWGVNVTVKKVVDALPKGEKPYIEDGIKYGGNPYKEFIGDPSDSRSYGVYDIPIQNVANKFKSGIINGRGMSLNEVLAVVKQNRPVIVWSSMNMGVPHYSNSWIYKPTGEKIKWLADLHAILVIGFNDTEVITSDTLTGTIRYFNRTTFEKRYNSFGKRALYY